MRIDEAKYDEIKVWIDMCKNTSFIAKKIGTSTTTVNRIRKSTSFKDYKRIMQEEINRRSKVELDKEESKEKEITITALHFQMNRIYEQLKTQSEALTSLVGYFRENTRVTNDLYNLLK